MSDSRWTSLKYEILMYRLLRISSRTTGRMGWIAYRKWKEIKQQPSTVGPGNMLGCSLVSFHFLGAIHPFHPVHSVYRLRLFVCLFKFPLRSHLIQTEGVWDDQTDGEEPKIQ